MKVSIPNEVLAHLVNVTSRVIKPNINIPVLRNILLDFSKDTLTLTATDLETQISIHLDLKAPKETKITVHSTTFSQYLNSLPQDDSVELELTDTALLVKSDSSKATFAIKPASEYPLLEGTNKQEVATIPADKLVEIIEKTIVATSNDDLRPILTGVHFNLGKESSDFVALDTYRMSYINYKADVKTPQDFTVPAPALNQLLKILNDSFIQALADTQDVTLTLYTQGEEGKILTFTYGPVTLTTRLLEGEYPNYKDILRVDTDFNYTIEHAQFKDALKRVGIFAQNSIGQKVVLKFAKDSVTLSAKAMEMGEVAETIPITANSEKTDLTIAFQLRFLQDLLNIIDSDTFILGSNGETSPAVVQIPDRSDFYHIIMPLKL